MTQAVQDIELPLLTVANAPADFAMVRDVYEARQAYASPNYSHVFLLHTPSAAELAYIETLKQQAYSPEIAKSVRGERGREMFPYCGNSLSERMHAKDGALTTGNLTESLPEGIGRDDYIARKQAAARDFTMIVRRVDDDWSPSNFNIHLLSAPGNVNKVHQDRVHTYASTDFGVGTPVASHAVAQQALQEGQPWAREAVLKGHIQETAHGVAFHPDAPLTSVARCMFEAGPGMSVLIKPQPTTAQLANYPNYKPSTHAFAWRNSRMNNTNDLRLRTLMS